MVKLVDSKNPCLVQESRTYLLYKPSYSQFSVEITATGYHGNKGRSGVSLNDTIRSADPENPQFGAKQRARIFKGAPVMALRSCHRA